MIVGAGIVGTYLGSLVGDARIFEAEGSPREKSCSGLLSASGLKALKLPYEDSIVNEVKGARITSGKEALTIKTPIPPTSRRMRRNPCGKRFIPCRADAKNCKFKRKLWDNSGRY